MINREILRRRGAQFAKVARRLLPGGRGVTGLIVAAFLLSGLFQRSAPVLLADIYPSVATQYTPSDGWLQFRGNHQNTGVSTSPMPATFKLLWTYEAGESIESSAAIYGGTVFVGSQKGELVALDLQSGSVRWKYSTKEPIGESSPCVGNGAVFIGDLSGVVHAVNLNDGKGLWTYKTGDEVKSSPVLIDDRVLIGSYDGHLYCLSARNGSLLWKVRTDGPVHCTAGVNNGVAYIAGCDEMFRAIRVSDGHEVFKVASGAYTGASPALAGQFAYYGTFDNEVLGVNLATKRVAWHYQHPQRQFPFYSSAGVVEGKVVLGGRDKLVHCLNAATGRRIWNFATKARVESSPALASNRVFVGSNDGRFYVLDFVTGAKLWEFNAGAPLSASPAIASGRVVIGSQDGRLYCFG
ncbi:MAG TPA: PQQ-binding-like beta-propeller repeat protein [Blastocatellia bacterium]|nr:PQQ-binding-like beta-propeller repeat protein [Blastocatellia bacterium]